MMGREREMVASLYLLEPVEKSQCKGAWRWSSTSRGTGTEGDTRGVIMEYILLDKMMFCKLRNLITVVFLSLGHSG